LDSPNFLCGGKPKYVIKEHGNALVNHKVKEVCSPSPTTPLSLRQQKKNNNNIINFHNVLKMMVDNNKLVFELLFVHK
jgi:hypothetical protein